MDQKTKFTIVGGVVLLIIAAAITTVFFLGKVSKSSGDTTQETTANPLAELPTTANSTSNSTISPTQAVSNTKIYNGQVFNLSYPSAWGVLSCSNSQNLELDPVTSTDLKNIVCDTALKPVTIIVTERLNCNGETVTLGTNKVTKSKTTTPTGVNYRWCVTVGDKRLDITHRVSTGGSRATSKDDFSTQIEQMISTVKAATRGS